MPVNLSGNFTLLSLEHQLKALFPILFTEDGISMLSRDPHP